MTDTDRIKKLRDRAEKAEDLAERQEKMIAWLSGELAKALGKAVRDDGELVCYDMPEESRDRLCHRGAEGCAECWAIAAEIAVTPIEYYLKPEYQGRCLFEESTQEFMERKRREARAAKGLCADNAQEHGKARVLQFSLGAAKPSADGKGKGLGD